MSKYECEPSEVEGGYWKELATLSQSCLYNKETIVKYKKSIMDAKYNRTLIKESFEQGLKDGFQDGIKQGIDKISLYSGISISELNALCLS